MYCTVLDVNLGLKSRIYRSFTFPDYSIQELGKIFRQKVEEKEFNLAPDVDVDSVLVDKTTEEQRKSMNARLVRILLQESIEEASNREAACTRLPSFSGGDEPEDIS